MRRPDPAIDSAVSRTDELIRKLRNLGATCHAVRLAARQTCVDAREAVRRSREIISRTSAAAIESSLGVETWRLTRQTVTVHSPKAAKLSVAHASHNGNGRVHAVPVPQAV
jgi:hypothetical protein